MQADAPTKTRVHIRRPPRPTLRSFVDWPCKPVNAENLPTSTRKMGVLAKLWVPAMACRAYMEKPQLFDGVTVDGHTYVRTELWGHVLTEQAGSR